MVDLNATKAAERAGFSKKTAYSQGQRLLKNVEIQKRIQKLQQERSERTQITADRVLKELAIIGFSDIRDYMTIEEGGGITFKTFEDMPELASRAIEVIEENRTILDKAGPKKKDDDDEVVINDKIRFRLHSKPGALELLGKHLGIFKDQPQELNLKGNITVNVVSAVPRSKDPRK